jgi:hypothetical protein
MSSYTHSPHRKHAEGSTHPFQLPTPPPSVQKVHKDSASSRHDSRHHTDSVDTTARLLFPEAHLADKVEADESLGTSSHVAVLEQDDLEKMGVPRVVWDASLPEEPDYNSLANEMRRRERKAHPLFFSADETTDMKQEEDIEMWVECQMV